MADKKVRKKKLNRYLLIMLLSPLICGCRGVFVDPVTNGMHAHNYGPWNINTNIVTFWASMPIVERTCTKCGFTQYE